MRGAAGLAFISCRSSSACVEGRARQSENWREEPVCFEVQ